MSLRCYPYKCECGNDWRVYKSLSDIDREERCAECGELGWRYIARTMFYGADKWDSSFNPGLGCAVKNRQHHNQLVKEKGLIEVGNEKVETIEKDSADNAKANEQKREKKFDKLLEEL